MAGIARAAGALLIGFAIAAAPASSAHAGSRGGVPPPDVQQVFDDEVIPSIRQTAQELGGAPSVYQDVDGVSNIAELFVFTPGYLHGGKIGRAYEPTGEWIATITADSVAVGTARVRVEGGVDPYMSQWNGDGELAGKLADAGGVDLVEDPSSGAFYAVFGDTIGPLNEAAVAILPTPTTLQQFQEVMVPRHAAEESRETEEPGLDGILIPGAVAVAAIAGIALLSARARGRRSATGSSPGR
jgi:hypothetical protein